MGGGGGVGDEGSGGGVSAEAPVAVVEEAEVGTAAVAAETPEKPVAAEAEVGTAEEAAAAQGEKEGGESEGDATAAAKKKKKAKKKRASLDGAEAGDVQAAAAEAEQEDAGKAKRKKAKKKRASVDKTGTGAERPAEEEGREEGGEATKKKKKKAKKKRASLDKAGAEEVGAAAAAQKEATSAAEETGQQAEQEGGQEEQNSSTADADTEADADAKPKPKPKKNKKNKKKKAGSRRASLEKDEAVAAVVSNGEGGEGASEPATRPDSRVRFDDGVGGGDDADGSATRDAEEAADRVVPLPRPVVTDDECTPRAASSQAGRSNASRSPSARRRGTSKPGRKTWGAPVADTERQREETRKTFDRVTMLLRVQSLTDPALAEVLPSPRLAAPASPASAGAPSPVERLAAKFDFQDEDFVQMEESKAQFHRHAELRQIRLERAERQRRMQQRELKAMREQQERETREREELLAEYEALKAEKVKQRRERWQQLQREREEEKERAAKARQAAAKHLKETPLHERLQRAYEREVVGPEQERVQRALEERRKVMGPVDREAIRAHEQEFLKAMEASRRECEEDLRRRVPPKYELGDRLFRSKAYETITDEEKLRLEIERQKERNLRKMLERRERYAALVRDMFAPRADPAKANELARLRARREEPRRRAAEAASIDPHKIDYMHEAFRGARKRRGRRSTSGLSVAVPRRRLESGPGSPSSAGSPRTPPRPDYLAEMRRKRSERALRSPGGKRGAKHKKKLTREEEVERLQQRARRLEMAAARKETELGHAAAPAEDAANDVGEVAEVADMYVDVIKAKLKLLEAFSHKE